MTWNHRVIKRVYSKDNTEYFEIVEAYYNKKNQVYAWMQDADSPFGDTLEELKEDIERMLRACEHPVLIESELPQGEMDEED